MYIYRCCEKGKPYNCIVRQSHVLAEDHKILCDTQLKLTSDGAAGGLLR